jgi:hypothetical protein
MKGRKNMGALSWLLAKPAKNPATSQQKKMKEKSFEVDFKDEAFILNLTDDIVEDVAFILNIEGNNHASGGGLSIENPYRNKEARDILKYQLNMALRNFEREKKIHLADGTENGQKGHPIVPYLKAYLFEAVRNEILAPSV